MSRKKVVTFGEIMMRLSTPGYARFSQSNSLNIVYGGAEANVAISLAAFGVDAEHVTKFPDNDFGRAASNYLASNNVQTQNIRYGAGRLGLYFLEQGALQRPSRIIYDRFDSAFARMQSDEFNWDEIFKDAAWFHWTGITPAISENAALACRNAVTAAKRHGVKISGDINYRRNLWQYGKSAREVMPELIRATDYVVAGAEDVFNCTGLKANSFEEASAILVKSFPNIVSVATTVRTTIHSNHNKISASLYAGGRSYSSLEHDLPIIVDRIGAGDAFMAGLIYGWLHGKSNQETLEFGAAACAWKHSIEGDANLASVEDIEMLASGQNTGRLLR